MMHESQAKKKFSDKINNITPEYNKDLAKINKHLNFNKEIGKSSARKTPTEVTCCKCKQRFILPFKPRKPEIYCDKCFTRPTKSSFSKPASQKPISSADFPKKRSF